MIVNCNKSIVKLPDGASCEVGDVLHCPQSCKSKWLCKNKEQTFIVRTPPADAKNSSAIAYTDDEILKYWGGDIADSRRTSGGVPAAAAPEKSAPETEKAGGFSFPRPVGAGAEVKTETKTETKVETKPSESAAASAGAETVAKKTERRSSFGDRSRRGGAGGGEETADEILKPERDYGSFSFRGKNYQYDGENLSQLKDALRDVFTYWGTGAVFKLGTVRPATELRDEFIWLITTVYRGRGISKSKVDAILKNNGYDKKYEKSIKFFYLFNDVIYERENKKGFYWCDGDSSIDRLRAEFNGRDDFVARYCSANDSGLRVFYRKHRAEVLNYLDVTDEEKFFDEMTEILDKNYGEVVLIDKNHDYEPINLGTVSKFKDNMQVPSGFELMQNMVAFLKKYRVTRMGVFRRTDDDFAVSERVSTEDDCIYETIDLSSSSNLATEYNNHLSLLREYVKEFKPDLVRIGALTFTRSNYSKELTEIVKDFCKTHLGHVTEKIENKYKSRALLAKSVYERKILNFTVENAPRVDEVMDMIAGANPEMEKYFRLYTDCVFQIDGVDYTAPQYIKTIMENDLVAAISAFESDNIVSAYFKVKVRTEVKLDELFKNYQKLYDEFTR